MRVVILTILAIIVIMAIIISIGFSLNPTERGDRKVLMKETTLWLKNIGNNFKNLGGFVVKQRWVPDLNDSRLNSTENKNLTSPQTAGK